MFIVTRCGKKLPVDDSGIDYENDNPDFRHVAIYPDDATLEPVWIVELNKNNWWHDQSKARNGEVLEFVAEVKFNKEPTPEQILWAMSAYDLHMHDYAFVRKGYQIAWEDD